MAGPTEASGQKRLSWKPQPRKYLRCIRPGGNTDPVELGDPGSGFLHDQLCPQIRERAPAADPGGPTAPGRTVPTGEGRGAAHVTRTANRGPRRARGVSTRTKGSGKGRTAALQRRGDPPCQRGARPPRKGGGSGAVTVEKATDGGVREVRG